MQLYWGRFAFGVFHMNEFKFPFDSVEEYRITFTIDSVAQTHVFFSLSSGLGVVSWPNLTAGNTLMCLVPPKLIYRQGK
jgi:hypothetical protein